MLETKTPSPRSFIIIKGEPKALQIERISMGNNGVYDVKFKSSPITFHYRPDDVVWIKNSQWYDLQHCKVFVAGKEQKNIADIRSFVYREQTHWRITFGNGYVQDYKHGDIRVAESCLVDSQARNTLEYLKSVAQTNQLGKDEDYGGILPAIYAKIDFIDKELAVAPYLYPQNNKVKQQKCPSLIFPFGCNASQQKAVAAAFEHQLSVIQGPPGTGKTQTILNIIANILIQGKTVLVVSNNNSATANVLEKLQKYGFGFVAASLGSRANKEVFVANQPTLPCEFNSWKFDMKDTLQKRHQVSSTLSKLIKVFALQEELVSAKQELKEIEVEWHHFRDDNGINDALYVPKVGVSSKQYMNIWLGYQSFAEGDRLAARSVFGKIKECVKWAWLNLLRRYKLGLTNELNPENISAAIIELQTLYYLTRIGELRMTIKSAEASLDNSDAKILNKTLTEHSMDVLKNELHSKYRSKNWHIFGSEKELRQCADEVLEQYPVVLSTTFSAKTSLGPDAVFDYLIMDEASQVSIETGAMALMCAKNAVIVGDTKQLPNVVTDDDKLKLSKIFDEYNVAKGYDSARYSFLESICNVVPDIQQTLLREHYRCHPKIINFCNQKFYGGNLLIMTDDNGEDNVMSAIRTVPGNHCRGHYNQREIDVIKQEVLPKLPEGTDIGIITPYNEQVNAINQQFNMTPEAATVHKYQGREKDTIIMSVTDDQITTFSDDPNLLNVAISRAKKQFCIVLSGNKQELSGNISELVDYINYNNFSVTESKLNSIFDYLYSNYTKQRMEYLSGSKRISDFDSENLTYKLLTDIVAEYPEFGHLGILCHTPLRNILHDYSLLNDDERRYAMHYATHIDFLVVNHVSKKPVLAIETDGYCYHNAQTDQHKRDAMKNHILDVYGLPLLRLSTTGSGERNKIIKALSEALGKTA